MYKRIERKREREAAREELNETWREGRLGILFKDVCWWWWVVVLEST